MHRYIYIYIFQNVCLCNRCHVSHHATHHISIATQTQTVSHVHFLGWPDHGCPDSADGFLHLVVEAERLSRSSAGPMVVHCSAGVGRTGIFATILTARKLLLAHATPTTPASPLQVCFAIMIVSFT